MMRLNVIMLGAPGAGKGTQASRLSRARAIPQISTGDMLRDGIKNSFPVALRAKEKMDRGELVDDDTIVAIVGERLGRPDTASGFILDGFPRTVPQARALDGVVEERGNDPLIVVDVEVPEEELVGRLASRRICSTCGTNAEPGDTGEACRKCGGPLTHRADDNEAVVRERLRVYAQNTRPLIDFYRDRQTFRAVNGAQSPDRVARDIDAAVDDAAAAGAGMSLGAQRHVTR